MDWPGGGRSGSPALEQTLARFGRREIFNTDRGSRFTSAAATGMLTAAGIRISMDGRSRWMDNVFIERLGRSSTRTFTSIAGSPTSGAG
jgi:transposase InsO family protein